MANSQNQNSLDDKEPILSKEELNLEVQAEYEMLLATIEKSRAERMQAQMFMAQQYADQKDGVDPNSEEAIAFKQAMEEAASKID